MAASLYPRHVGGYSTHTTYTEKLSAWLSKEGLSGDAVSVCRAHVVCPVDGGSEVILYNHIHTHCYRLSTLDQLEDDELVAMMDTVTQ